MGEDLMGLRGVEDELFAAIAGRDLAALERLIAPDLVMHTADGQTLDRAALLAGIGATPGTIEAIAGEHVTARRLADGVGVICGVQVARVRLDDGQVVVDRGAFTDVFAWRDGRWVLVYAFVVSAAALAGPA